MRLSQLNFFSQLNLFATMAPRTAIITYSLYHHIAALAELAKAGVSLLEAQQSFFKLKKLFQNLF